LHPVEPEMVPSSLKATVASAEVGRPSISAKLQSEPEAAVVSIAKIGKSQRIVYLRIRT
jgi:hypothetical protein